MFRRFFITATLMFCVACSSQTHTAQQDGQLALAASSATAPNAKTDAPAQQPATLLKADAPHGWELHTPAPTDGKIVSDAHGSTITELGTVRLVKVDSQDKRLNAGL